MGLWEAGTVVLCFGWVAVSLTALWRYRALPRLPAVTPLPDEGLPRVSVIVCARNEAHTLGPALQSLLAQDYPDLQVVVVDDRSEDGTDAVLADMAAADPRIVPVTVARLPPDTLGKVHAQARGLDHADGAWVLFTDADIHFGPDCLRRAVSHLIATGDDHLVVFPVIQASGGLLRAFMHCFLLLGYCAMPTRKGGRLPADRFMGMGAFNLVRRAALAQTLGLAWLKMEVIDDLGLGLLLQQAGFRTRLILGEHLLRVAWYPHLAALARGLEKNAYAALGWRPVSALIKLVLLGLFALAPLGALVGTSPLPVFAAAVAVTVNTLVGLVHARACRLPLWTAASFLPGLLLIFVLVARAVWLAHRRGGVSWRDTHYDLNALRAGARVHLSLRRSPPGRTPA